MTETLVVRDNPEAGRYEAVLDEVVAGIATYRADEHVVTFLHTEVDPRFEGRGIGSQLARAALDDVRRQGKSVRPLCPFINRWIQSHEEYADLVLH